MPEVTQLVLSVDSRQVKNASGDLDKLSRSGHRRTPRLQRGRNRAPRQLQRTDTEGNLNG